MSKHAGPIAADRRGLWIAWGAAGALLLAGAFAYLGAPLFSHPDDVTRDTADTPVRSAPADTSPTPVDIAPAPAPQAAPETGTAETGNASWYEFDDQRTANGETMDADRLTAAHRTLPFGTKVKVENVDNGRIVVVRINDRGPFAGDRIIDISKEAAEHLDMIEDGVTEVNVAPVPTDSVGDPGEPIQ